MKKTDKYAGKFIENLNDVFSFDKTPPANNVGYPEMDFSQMTPFPGHIFQLYEGQQLEDMIDSIKHLGILLPIMLWHKEQDLYIILSGHNRIKAAKELGITKAKVLIKEDLTQEEAILIVTETNMRQRSFSDMRHSERALCLSRHYGAAKNQGRRNDLINEIEALLNPHDERDRGTCSQVENKLKNLSKIGGKYSLSKDTVARYIRIATLVPDFLKFLDTKKIAFLAAYDISFIEDKTKQTLIAEIVKRDDCKIDMKKAALLREYYEKNKLTDKAIEDIIAGIRVGKNPGPKSYKVRPVVLKKFFTGEETQDEIDDTVTRALAMFFESQNSEQGENENLT